MSPTIRTRSIALVYSRPSDFGREDEWNEWYDHEHLPATAAKGGAWVATRWETIDRPPGFSSPVGFTHLAIYEFEDDGAGAARMFDALDGPRNGSSGIHPCHAVIDVDVLVPFGRWNRKTEPSAALRGQVMAYVAPNDPATLADWNRWYDDVHAPDMMGSGAFTNTTRWARVAPRRWGPNFLTLYDVEIDSVADAVLLSGNAMGPAKAAGRLRDDHAGGLRSALHPAGAHGPRGYRRDG